MKHRLSKTTWVALGVLAVAAVFIVLGCVMRQPLQILHKAALICYECIGLG